MLCELDGLQRVSFHSELKQKLYSAWAPRDRMSPNMSYVIPSLLVMKLLCDIDHTHGFKRDDRRTGQPRPSSSLYLPEVPENKQTVTAANE